MAKKKVKLDLTVKTEPQGFVKHFWCVNCGFYGFFKKERLRNVKCSDCGYEDVMKMDEEDYKKDAKERPWILKNEVK